MTTREKWLGGDMPVARWGLILNLLVPLVILIWDARHGNLGADPVNDATHTTGLCALTFLLLSLAVTPVRALTGWTWLVQFRRSLGVYAFAYACAHLGIYFWWDRARSLHSTVYEIIHRYYLAIGFASLALMFPLWATSFNGAIRTLGPVWWKRLHRLTYLAAALGCYHLYLQTKADKRRPDVYIAILAGLLLWRVIAAIAHQRRGASAPDVVSAGASSPAAFWKGELKVVSMRRETEEVRTFRLATPDGSPIPFDFQAGQFLNLAVEIEGKRVSRSYTIASPPTRRDYVELTIKREKNGRVSHYLHDMLKSGQAISLSAPAGRFTFDASQGDTVLLLAGGVGITPLMSILRDLTDRSWPGRIDLILSVKSRDEIIFREELRKLADTHANLHVHITLSREAPADWPGERGRINADLIRRCVPDAFTRPAYICGPDAMAAAVRAELLSAGTHEERVHVESFTPAAAVAADPVAGSAPKQNAGGPRQVTFARSGISAPLPAAQTILEAAEAAGVSIDYQCRSGICGTCRCKLLQGTVRMTTRDALSDADEKDGYILACQAHGLEDVTIDV